MDDLLRLNGAVEHEPAIDLWLSQRESVLGAIARRWFARIKSCSDDVLELLHDGCPVACVEDAPFAYVNVFRAHVNVGFFVGSELPDPAGQLEGTGRRMRHVKLRAGAAIDDDALGALIDAAYADIRARLTRE